MCRQGARSVTSLGIMLSSPFLVFPGRRGGGGDREPGGGEGRREEEEYEGQLKYSNGSVSRTRVSSHTKNVTPPQPIMQLLKLLFCGSESGCDDMSVCVCVCMRWWGGSPCICHDLDLHPLPTKIIKDELAAQLSLGMNTP